MIKEKGAEYYNARIPADLTFDPYWKKMYNEVIKHLSLDAAITDLGCGTGHLARILYKKGYRNYWGLDFAKARISIAKRIVPEFEFTVGSLYNRELQRRFAEYDIFVILEVLEHLTYDLDVLNAIPKGRLIILSVPNTRGIGHVRRFKNVKDVTDRYGSMIAFNTVIRIRRHRSACFLLGYGVKN